MTLTRELIAKKYGAEQLTMVRPVLRAVKSRLVHAQIHYHDYLRVLETHLGGPIQKGVWLSHSRVGEDSETAKGASNLFFLTSEAYIFACMQALHAIADNLAHVTHYALGSNLDEVRPIKRIAMDTVLARIREMAASSMALVPLQNAFEDLSEQPQYIGLSHIVNHVKHHGGLCLSVRWATSEGETHCVMLSSFLRNGTYHPEREISAVLKDAYDTMNPAVVQIGCALNDYLQGNP